ncbi:MAG: hypothetical protein FJ144_25450 [Deltaproteobacteria bacterium]|nr:hypothetical protein [Deltaproteobacteria bacterium]
MRYVLSKLHRLACAGLLLLLSAGVAEAGQAAFFEFDYPPRRATFVLQLRDPDKIEHARRILRGEETAAVHVMGKVRAQERPWNEPWHFILAPQSIEFFELAIEVCDASIRYVEQHLDEVGGAFLPGRVWCPWGSRLLREVTPDRHAIRPGGVRRAGSR